MAGNQIRLLLVDDDEVHREWLRRHLGGQAFIHDADTGARALDALARASFDCVLLDNRLPDYNAVELLPLIQPARVPVIVLTAAATPELIERTTLLGARACLEKTGLAMQGLLEHIANCVVSTG